MSRYIFAGASSALAQKAADILTSQGHSICGISRSAHHGAFSEWHQVSSYRSEDLPDIEGPVDGLVYFPGSIVLKPFARLSEEDFLQDFRINALGAASVTQKYLPALKASGKGSVVFISTVANQTGMAFHTSIAMAKGALESLSRSLAAEFAPTIRFNAVAPSLTATPLSDRLVNSEEKVQAAGQRHPLKRIGTTTDIAESILFLLSEKSSWITGQTLHVDGGMSSIR